MPQPAKDLKEAVGLRRAKNKKLLRALTSGTVECFEQNKKQLVDRFIH